MKFVPTNFIGFFLFLEYLATMIRMGLTEFLIVYFTLFIEKAGYFGVFVLMTMESMIFPVPSEAVMPFTGFLWFQGKMTFIAIFFASTIGSIVGSLLSYYIGKYGGKPFINKFGKYLLLNEHHLTQTEQFFQKYGEKTIFISRFIPIVRHLISLPAGVGKMNIYKFSLFTVAGASIWNAFLAYLGYQLGSRWEIIRKYSEVLDIIVIACIVLAAGYFVFKARKKLSFRNIN